MALTYEPIATYTVPSNTTSLSFTSISGAYTDLIMIVGGTSNNDGSLNFQFNSDTNTNYSATYLYGTGTSAVSQRQSNNNKMVTMGRLNSSGGTSIINFQNYANATTYKSVLGRGSASSLVIAAIGLWRSTSAINRIDITMESSYTINAGTVFTLYGVLNA